MMMVCKVGTCEGHATATVCNEGVQWRWHVRVWAWNKGKRQGGEGEGLQRACKCKGEE